LDTGRRRHRPGAAAPDAALDVPAGQPLKPPPPIPRAARPCVISGSAAAR
jgi:hypothetical protein